MRDNLYFLSANQTPALHKKGRPNELLWADLGCWVWMFPSARRNVTSQVMDSYVNYILILWNVFFRKNKYVKS